MRYRQWKKNYKKRYGINPPATIDKRKQRKIARKALKKISATNWSETLNRATQTITDGLANFMRALGKGFDTVGTVCRNTAEYMQPLEIEGCLLSWEVKRVVCDYGVYENNGLTGGSQLKLITNSRSAAEKIVEIMQQDNLEHMRSNYPEQVRKRKDITDALAYGLQTTMENCSRGERRK